MTHYRIYLLGLDGKILSGKDTTCLDDDDARETARSQAVPYQQAEIWTGTRLVGKVIAQQEAD